MTRLLEDYLSDKERQAIDAVLESHEIRFDRLIRLADLNSAEDFKHTDLRGLNFCGADLRGFDFTGSDLRDIATDEHTQIDESTILEGAKVHWIKERDIPIVHLMQEVEAATASSARLKALATLEKKFGKSNHVVSFVVNAACETETTQAFLDYTDFLPAKLLPNHLVKLIKAGERVLSRKSAKSRSRTRREKTAIFAASTINEHLAKAEESFSATWYRSLAEIMDGDLTTNALKGTSATLDINDIKRALQNLRSPK